MKRLVLVLVALTLTTAVAAGCSKSNPTVSNEAQGAASSSPGSSEKTGSTTAKTTPKTSGGSSDTTAKKSTTTTGSSSSSTLPGGVSIPSIPNAGDLQKCTQLLTAYAAIFAPLAGGQFDEQASQQATQALEQIKTQVPDNIKDDLETLENGVKNAKSYTDLSQFLSSPEYEKANEEITNYFTTECNKIGGQ